MEKKRKKNDFEKSWNVREPGLPQEPEISVLDLEDEDQKAALPDRKKSVEERKELKKQNNREYIRAAYLFTAIFLAMLAYFIYFVAVKSQDITSSSYNSRQELYEKSVVRGDIISADDQLLATTQVSSDGSETRVYPYGSVFSHVVGYSSHGKSGIEALANLRLLTSNTNVVQKIKNELKEEKSTGDSVVTTLRSDLQQAAYDALGANKGAVVVMEPSTGRILAMVSKPDFDPNALSSTWNDLLNDTGSALLNRATQGQYTPGSVFKIVTALEYMRENPSWNEFAFDCSGSYTAENYKISCYHGKAHGEEDFAKAFAKSCNCAFSSMGLTLDRESYRKTAEELLFNTELPLSVAYNKSSFTLSDGDPGQMAMMTAMGQGNTMVSPVHIALITSAVANGGVLMNPYLVSEIQNDAGKSIKKFSPSVYGKLMSAQEASDLTALMEGVVENGTASALSTDAYSVAGKTGTAEFSSDKSKSHAWFTGFSNVGNPDIVVTVIVEEVGSGSEYAVPIAKKIFDTYYKN